MKLHPLPSGRGSAKVEPCERAPISCWWTAGWSRAASRAQALILAGKVFSGERRIAKAGDTLAARRRRWRSAARTIPGCHAAG